MADWYGAKYAGKWYKMDKQLLIPVFMLFIMLLSFVLMGLLEESIFGMGLYFSMILVFLPLIFFTWNIYKQRKGMWTKVFSYDNDTVVRVIENTLKQNRIPYTKLKMQQQDYIGRYPLKYAEIFEINQYQMSVKVQKQMAMGSIVGVGPISPHNEIYIENIKKNLDYAFTPRGLEEVH